MKYQILTAIFGATLLGGCNTPTVFVKMEDPACLAAPVGYQIKHSYKIVEYGEGVESTSDCPTILVPVEQAQVAQENAGRAVATPSRPDAGRVLAGSGSRRGGGGSSSGPSWSVTQESVSTGGGRGANITSSSVSGSGAPPAGGSSGSGSTVQTGSFSIGSDGSITGMRLLGNVE